MAAPHRPFAEDRFQVPYDDGGAGQSGDGMLCRPATEEEQFEQILKMTEDPEPVDDLQMDVVPGVVVGDQDELAEAPVGLAAAAWVGGGSMSSTPPQVEHVGEVPRRLSGLKTIKGDGEECSICFAPLPAQPVCVLFKSVYSKKRACRHYFHMECAQLLMRTTPAPHACPNCREVFQQIGPLPDVRLDSRAWFNTVDAADTGTLARSDVIDGLSATLPVDPEMLASSLQGDLWAQWDPDGKGQISRDAFEDPARGLLQFVLYSLPSLRREAGGENLTAPVPDLLSSREAWFRYWDENSSLSLEFLQFLRALVRSLRLDGTATDAAVLRTVVERIWQEFGLTGKESSEAAAEEDKSVHRPVSLKLFCEKPDGFCDVLVDELQKEFGLQKFRRMMQRAQLLQQPVSALKTELRKLNFVSLDLVEKGEIVDKILDAREAALAAEVANQPPSPTSNSAAAKSNAAAAQSSSDYQNLTLKEIQAKLREMGVPYGHCCERVELENLLAFHTEKAKAKKASGRSQGATSQSGNTQSAKDPNRQKTTRCLPCSVQ